MRSILKNEQGTSNLHESKTRTEKKIRKIDIDREFWSQIGMKSNRLIVWAQIE